MSYKGYLDAKALYARLALLKTKHPATCDVEILPKPTNEGREVKMLRLSAGSAPVEERHAVLITAGVHAREWAQPDAILTFAEKLLACYAAQSDFTAGGYTLTKDYVKAVLERLVVYVIPIVNPDGREFSFNALHEDWRKNRTAGGGGVDINRNFDILWDFEKHYVPDPINNAGVSASKDPNDYQVYIGPAAESEPETRNVKTALEDKGIRYYFDLHSAVPGIFHVWGLDTNQTTDGGQNFSNPAWDRRRDGTVGAAYGEFIPDAVQRAHQTLGALMQQAILRATSRSYVVQQSAKTPLYVATGTADDFAFSRDMERRLCFTVEFGDYNVEGFHPDFAAQFPKIENEVHAAMAAALDRLAGPPLTGGSSSSPPSSAPPPAPPKKNPFAAAWSAFVRFLGRIFGRLFGFLARKPVVFSPPVPAPSSVPPPSSVHSLRLDKSTAGAGERVRGVLLDASLDFTQVQKAQFYVFLQVPPRPGATGNLYWRVPDFRFLGARELEFSVPPVGTGSTMMVPPGGYIVLCRYGFWSVEGDRLLTVS